MKGFASYLLVSAGVLVGGVLLLDPSVVPGVNGRLVAVVALTVALLAWLVLQTLDSALVGDSGTD